MKRVNCVLTMLAVWLAWAVVVTPASANGCRSVGRPVIYHDAYVPVVEKIVEKAVNVVRFLDFPLYNVFYAPGVVGYGGYGYTPPAYVPPAPVYPAPAYSAPAAVAPCEDKLRLLEQRLQRLEGGTPRTSPGPMPPADGARAPEQPVGVAALLTTHCASCHESSVSKARGNGLTLTNGSQVAQLSPEQVGKILEEVASKRMPKGKPMSDAERLAFTLALVSGK